MKKSWRFFEWVSLHPSLEIAIYQAKTYIFEKKEDLLRARSRTPMFRFTHSISYESLSCTIRFDWMTLYNFSEKFSAHSRTLVYFIFIYYSVFFLLLCIVLVLSLLYRCCCCCKNRLIYFTYAINVKMKWLGTNKYPYIHFGSSQMYNNKCFH